MYNNGGASVNCTRCSQNLIQSFDGWNCVNASTQCAQETSFLTDNSINGALILENSIPTRTCIQCDSSTVATPSGCVSCFPFVFIENVAISVTSVKCSTDCKETVGGICLLNVTNTNSAPNDFSVPIGTSSIDSWFLKQYAPLTYYQCRSVTNRNSTACQILLNMCTLIYTSDYCDRPQIDVCCALRSILDISKRASLPLLEIGLNLAEYQSNSINEVNIKLNFDKTKTTCETNSLNFVAAKYNLNGKLISYSLIDLNELEICNLFDSGETRTSGKSFITVNYKKSCTISVKRLMQLANKEPIFYELYLRYQLENDSLALLPVPVVINNRNSKLNRRFFLVDQISAKSSELDELKNIRYASKINIEFNLLKNSDSGRLYPPILRINYDFISTINLNATISPSFEVNYFMALDTEVSNIWISIGVLAGLAFLWSIIKTWAWNKRSGKYSSDIITVFKFLMYLCSSVANVIFVVFIGTCIWWLFIFKGQTFAYLALPMGSQLNLFKLLIIVAFILKTISILHLILVQVSFDIFAIDWEKPKYQPG